MPAGEGWIMVPIAKTGLRDIVLKLLNDRAQHQLFRLIDQIFDQCDQTQGN